jgi:carboxyl-terminal processing protease
MSMRHVWFFLVPMLCLGPLRAQEKEGDDVSPYREMKTLARAVELIRQDYVDEDKTGYEELIYNALRGMLEELDPHSDFMDPKDFKGMQEDTRSEFGGLGVVVGMKNDRLTIVAPMEGTPGFRAGLLPGDVLLEIDGQSAEKMSLRDAVENCVVRRAPRSNWWWGARASRSLCHSTSSGRSSKCRVSVAPRCSRGRARGSDMSA